MRLFDYRQSSDDDKNQWLNTFQITTGLKYFGGKSQIGKDLMHRICNMAEKMDMDGKHANIFIDGFTGGGKIGLSIPEGWFDTIVMNDLNYGIVSFYRCCKDYQEALFKMIKLLGSIMDKNIYMFCAFHRSNNGIVSEKKAAQELIDTITALNKDTDDEKKWIYITDDEKKELLNINELIENKSKKVKSKYKIAEASIEKLSDEKVAPLVAAAMTYWVTQLEFLGVTDPYTVSYAASGKDNKTFNATGTNEKERIERAIKHAAKHIQKVHEKLERNNIIIENLDYRELIKKYNGKEYVDTYGQKHDADTNLASQNKLWYFDPPYHPATLFAGIEAPYEDKFSWELARSMVKILHNDEKSTYGELEYFIKSDYDPKAQYETYLRQLKAANKRFDEKIQAKVDLTNDSDIIGLCDLFDSGRDISEDEIKRRIKNSDSEGDVKKNLISILIYMIRMKKQVSFAEAAYHDFDVLEENTERTDDEGKVIPANKINPVYYKLKLGEYSKGVAEDTVGSTKGVEYVWCRGNYLPEDDNLI